MERQPAANSVPNFSMEDKRVAVELWKDKVPLQTARTARPPPDCKDCKATSIPELQCHIQELWTLRMGDSPYLRSLVESMPRRLQEVISRDGNTTKY